MPNYNNAPFLRECLQSIFDQTYDQFNLVIIDDASTDESVQIIKSFNDNRILLIERKTNGGIVAALNDGLEVIDSEFIVRHDGDDLMHKDRIALLVDFMNKNPHIDICSSDIKTFGLVEKEIIYERSIAKNKANLIFGHSIGHASSIFRTSLLKSNNIRYSDEFLYKEDYDLFYRLMNKANVTSIPGFLYYYRLQQRHDNQNQVNLKLETTKRFYTRVLNDLGIQPGNKAIDIHIALAKNVSNNFSLSDFKEHVQLILKKNSQILKYPESELKITLIDRLSRVIYTKIEKNELSLFTVLLNQIKYHKPFLRFYLARKLNQKNDKN